MDSVWRRLPRPIHALAPMEDVTDTVFRRLIMRWGRPDIVFTEFIHTDVVLAERKWPGITPRLDFTSEEHPIIAQIWGNEPEQYAKAAMRIRELGFDGIDINMGCPVRKIRRKGACSALIGQPNLAAELIAAAKSGGLPVSVKTRIGLDESRTEQWCGHLLGQSIDALTVHGRTALRESDGAADWREVRKLVSMAREISPRTAILGNGDVVSRDAIDQLCDKVGVDGVMVGRGIFTDPLLFRTDGVRFDTLDRRRRMEMLREHIELYESHWGERRNYEVLKKYFKIYCSGDANLQGLRERLNETHDYSTAYRVLETWARQTGDVRIPG